MKLSKPEKNHGLVELSIGDAVEWWKAGLPGYTRTGDAGDVRDPDSSWRGGTPASLISSCEGKLSMGPYVKALEDLAPMFRQFTAEYGGQIMRRKRTFSEHDGEFVHERRLSETPFQHCKRKPVPLKIVKLDVNMCVSGGVSAKDMDAYGATVWAVAQLLERMGRKVEITWIARNGDGYGTRYTVRIPLKKATQYLAPSLLAATLTTNFYRRLGFALCTYACQGNKLSVPSGLGPTYFTDPISYKNGVMTFCPANAYRFGGEYLQAELRKALTA